MPSNGVFTFLHPYVRLVVFEYKTHAQNESQWGESVLSDDCNLVRKLVAMGGLEPPTPAL